MEPEQPLTRKQVLQKLRHYCAYQERCHQEVKDKLYSYGLHRQEVEESVAQLIEEGYLNEERFAILFAGGKFRSKKWGRVKIRFELKKRNISDYCIRKALQQIDEEDYLRTIERLAEERWQALKTERHPLRRKFKTIQHLQQKGYEADVIRSLALLSGK